MTCNKQKREEEEVMAVGNREGRKVGRQAGRKE
jgi:hypothetical protein